MLTRRPFHSAFITTVRIALPVIVATVCGGGGDGIGVSTEICSVSSVSITPNVSDATIGTPLTLTASVAASHCSPLPTVAWLSSATNIATVSSTGVVTAIAPGTTTITATAASKSGTSAITVRVPVATLTLSSPGTSVVTGSTLQLNAQAKDANGNVLTGRTFAWQSSNDGIANVNSSGVLTGVSAGNATITVSADGKTATLNITVTSAATLGITSITPTAGAASVGIESTIQINFSGALNAGTVTASSVRVTSGANTVLGTRTVNGSTVIFTPASLLTEFRTTYTVTVTVDVTSGAGNHLPNDATATFTTVFWDPAYYYRITNEYAGPTKALDTYADNFNCFFTANTGTTSGQNWYFTPTATPGYYTIRNQFQGENKALEGGDAPNPCFLTSSATVFTGMLWQPVVFAGTTGFRLQNLNFGATKSLDSPLSNAVNIPAMTATGNFSGQIWYFTRSAHR